MSDSDELDHLRQQKRDQLLNQHQAGPSVESTAPAEPVSVTDADHFNQIVSTTDLVLVDFYADWCGPCQMLEPTIAEVAADHPITVVKVDIDQHDQLAHQHGVRSVPTLVFYSNGTVVEQLLGVQDKPTLDQLITQYT